MEKTIKRIILCVCVLIGGMSVNAQFVTFKNRYEVEAANKAEATKIHLTYAMHDKWKSCSVISEEVSFYSDGQAVVNNFDYKTEVPGLGTVYF